MSAAPPMMSALPLRSVQRRRSCSGRCAIEPVAVKRPVAGSKSSGTGDCAAAAQPSRDEHAAVAKEHGRVASSGNGHPPCRRDRVRRRVEELRVVGRRSVAREPAREKHAAVVQADRSEPGAADAELRPRRERSRLRVIELGCVERPGGTRTPAARRGAPGRRGGEQRRGRRATRCSFGRHA